MSLTVFNTLGRRTLDFAPLEKGHVRMYTCGPTVYNVVHIGNLRTFLWEDVLRRHLTALYGRVTQVMNLTDVDDKTIRGAAEAGLPLREFTQKYADLFFRDIDRLAIQRVEHYPRATDHIEGMQEITAKLLESKHAYESEGSVYFRIATFPDYGKLSGIDLTQARRGDRVADDEYEKEDVKDFVLWKAEKPGEPAWDSPWGRGRPGWHIECSAMSMKYLGQHFDIHTGAVDNIFPHHENEIAQSEAATGETFVDVWLHAEHLIVEGEKMAKSKGKFLTLDDVLARRNDPAAVRYLLLSVPYRRKLNFTWDALAGAAAAVDRIRSAAVRIGEVAGSGARKADAFDASARGRKFVADFQAAMNADLNTSEALGALFPFLREVNAAIDEGTLDADGAAAAAAALRQADAVLGILPAGEEVLPAEIEAAIAARNTARARRDFAESDRLRDELAGKGIVLEDGPAGTRWRKA
ncbi:MAG: cysteine--tRNA ligase [Acidobacteriota bacterium]